MSQLYVDNIKNRTGGAIGAPAGIVVSGVGTFSGNVSIGGTLTYEDVTNIDSVGIITARSDISIADKIIHTGDTNTAIRFPVADTFSVETAGSERVRVTSDGKVRVPDNGKFTAGAGDDLQIYHDDTNSFIVNQTGGLFIDNTLDDADIYIRSDNGSGGTATYLHASGGDGQLRLYHYGNLKFNTTATGVSVTGTVSDSLGPLRRVKVDNASTGFNLTAAYAGQLIRQSGSGQTINFPNGVFSAGDMVSFFNVGTGTLTISAAGTMYNTADAATGNRTIAAKGMATVICTASNEFAISGSQLT